MPLSPEITRRIELGDRLIEVFRDNHFEKGF
jgi:hypothetical protein